MTDTEIKLLCDLKELQSEMIKIAVTMVRLGDDEEKKHGRELNGAAEIVGTWIRGME